MTFNLRSVIQVHLQHRDIRIPSFVVSPAIIQSINNKITGLQRVALHHVELFLFHFQNAKGNKNSIGFPVVIPRLDRLKTAKFSAS